jgi:hypothetical protein
VFVDTPGFQTVHGNALNRSLNRSVQGRGQDVDLVLFVTEAGRFNQADAKVLALLDASRHSDAAGGQQARPGATALRRGALAAAHAAAPCVHRVRADVGQECA